MTCWLDERQLARVNRQIDAIRESIPVGPYRPGTRLHLVTVSLSPVPVGHPQLRDDDGRKGRTS
jgi:hypothetical protein